MNYTIKKLLNHEQLRNSRLIAGEEGIQNVIVSTNMMDNPQSFEWLRKGDLVLTTGFVFKDDPEFQKQVIIELVAAKCSGLALKPRKYFGEIPQEMIQLANEHHLPIIEIPADLSLAQFSNIINKKILSIQDSIVQKTLYIHEKLTDISLAGGGIKDILTELSFVIRNPILVLNERGTVLAFQDWHNALGTITKPNPSQQEIEGVITSILTEVPKDIPFKKSIKKQLQLSQQSVVCRILPIKALEKLLGYIIVFEVSSKLERIDYIAIEKGATIIALDILKQKDIEFATLRIRDDFFHDLLTGKVETEREANQLASQHGLETNTNNACVVIELKKKAWAARESESALSIRHIQQSVEESLAERMKAKPNGCAIKSHIILSGKTIILIMQVEQTMSRKTSKELVNNICYQLHEQLAEEFPDMEFRFGIGKYYSELVQLYHSRDEAEAAMEMNQKYEVLRAVSHYDDYLLYELLNKVPNQEDLEYFYEDTLRTLDEYDQMNNMNLVETLRTYFEHMGNIKDAASALYIHRNTMLYRMDKIMSILEVDFHQAQDVLKLQLGLYIRQILNKK